MCGVAITAQVLYIYMRNVHTCTCIPSVIYRDHLFCRSEDILPRPLEGSNFKSHEDSFLYQSDQSDHQPLDEEPEHSVKEPFFDLLKRDDRGTSGRQDDLRRERRGRYGRSREGDEMWGGRWGDRRSGRGRDRRTWRQDDRPRDGVDFTNISAEEWNTPLPRQRRRES